MLLAAAPGLLGPPHELQTCTHAGRRHHVPANPDDPDIPSYCLGCDHPLPLPKPWGRVVDIAQVKTGWLAHGEIAQIFCPVCAQAYALLIKYIPIECPLSHARVADQDQS
jgi:hypothetical protein